MKPDKKNTCSACGGDRIDGLFLIESRVYAPGRHFNMLGCETCGLAFLDLIPDADFFKHYYPDNYAPHNPTQVKVSTARKSTMQMIRQFAFGDKKNTSKGLWKGLRQAVSRLYNKTAYRSLPDYREGGKLLDIGCGIGSYLSAARDLGWDAHGVEVNGAAAGHAQSQGLQVTRGDFETAEYPENYFHVVTLWHVFEHFPFPSQVLSKIEKILKDDGLLIMGIPNFASMDRKLFKESWNGYEIPLHLYHYTPDTISQILGKAGFSCRKIVHTIRPVDMASSLVNTLEKTSVPAKAPFLKQVLGLLALPFAAFFSFTRQSSNIVVYAGKNTFSRNEFSQKIKRNSNNLNS